MVSLASNGAHNGALSSAGKCMLQMHRRTKTNLRIWRSAKDVGQKKNTAM